MSYIVLGNSSVTRKIVVSQVRCKTTISRAHFVLATEGVYVIHAGKELLTFPIAGTSLNIGAPNEKH